MAVYPAGAYASANSERLTRNSETKLQPSGDMTWVAWVYFTSKPTYAKVAAKYITSGNQRQWALQYTASNDRLFMTCCVDGTSTGAGSSYATAPSTGVWCFVSVTYDATSQALQLALDGVDGTPGSVSTVFATGTGPLEIGAYNSGTEFWNGKIGPVGIAKGYKLTTEELAEIRNGGNGRLWTHLSSGLKTKFGSAWWDMTETGGDRASCDGTLNLTDNNTVTYGDGPVLVPVTLGAYYRAQQ